MYLCQDVDTWQRSGYTTVEKNQYGFCLQGRKNDWIDLCERKRKEEGKQASRKKRRNLSMGEIEECLVSCLLWAL